MLRAFLGASLAGVASATTVHASLKSLREDGMAVVCDPSVRIPVALVERLRVLVAEGRALGAATAGGIGFVSIVQGRHHASLLQPNQPSVTALGRWTAKVRAEVEAVVDAYKPLASAFFGDDRYVLSQCVRAAQSKAQRTTPLTPTSRLQLLAIDPGASAQIWHRDNFAQGLTVIIPLVDVPSRSHGPTELIPGTHHLTSLGDLPACASLCAHSGVQLGCAPSGCGLAFDSRVVHRGSPSSEYRPALVIRFDRPHTAPPGAGLLGTTMVRGLGALLHGVCATTREL